MTIADKGYKARFWLTCSLLADRMTNMLHLNLMRDFGGRYRIAFTTHHRKNKALTIFIHWHLCQIEINTLK